MRNIIRFITAVQISAALLFCPLTSRPIASPQDDRASVTTGQGLHVVTFDLAAGKVKVFLPDDMAAGDTISGTVTTEPKGRSEEEKAKNQDTLNGTVIDLGDGNKVKTTQPGFTWTPQMSQPSTPVKYLMKVVEIVGQDGKRLAATNVPLNSTVPPIIPDLGLPKFAQTGRPTVITGPFDGNASNTNCTIGGQNTTILAESMRKAVALTPTGIIGPAEIVVSERGKESSGQVRMVSVNLSAPKTNLTRSEKTTVSVQVNGLQGITSTIPLEMVTTGTVNMQGGNTQNIQIQPSQVPQNGVFTKAFELTATQAGSFSVTGTVLVGTPAEAKDACKCVCEFANPPIVTSGNGRKKGVAYQSFAPNMKNTACNGNQCSVKRIEYSWSIGAGSTATYTVSGGDKSSKELTLDVTKSGTVELSVTVTVICSDGSTCSATGSKTFTVKA